MDKAPLAVLCSDLHLSHTPPSARAGDWYAAMENGLRELGALAEGLGDTPIICAGDLFDRWNSPPELINFALDCLPKMWAVPGQHDLPNHNHDERHKSAYETLVKAWRVLDIGHGLKTIGTPQGLMNLFGFPWGKALHGPGEWTHAQRINLAVVHSYIWVDGTGYPGAPEDKRARGYRVALEGYNACLFGDNHKSFITHWTDDSGNVCTVYNNGTFFARHSDERNYKPHVGVLYDDGSIERHYLDTSRDEWADVDTAIIKPELNFDAAKFLDGLQTLGMDALDYRAAVGRALDELGAADEVRKLVMEAMEHKNGK
jgi:hypothetical protein